MKRVLDFNTVERPTLELVFRDEARTRVRVGMPTEALIQELQSFTPGMQDTMRTGNEEGQALTYDLMARLLSFNREGIKITGEELRGKYDIDLELLAIFFSEYWDFVSEIVNAKN